MRACCAPHALRGEALGVGALGPDLFGARLTQAALGVARAQVPRRLVGGALDNGGLARKSRVEADLEVLARGHPIAVQGQQRHAPQYAEAETCPQCVSDATDGTLGTRRTHHTLGRST